MRLVIRLLTFALVCLLFCKSSSAQPPWGRGGDDRGRGDRGRGDRGRGDRGDRGRGGDDRGGFGGGFDPMRIIERIDRNGNKKLEPEEMEGRTKYFIERFAPGLDTSRPISFDELRKKIEERRGKGDDRGRSSWGSSRNGGIVNVEDQPPLVPGFDLIDEIPPVPGFGTLGEFFQVAITAADRKEAEEVIGRYDRDGDGILNAEEIKRGRWYSEPMTYDQNKDGRLSSYELAVRYARRRISKEEEKRSSDRGRDDRRRRDRRDRDDDDDEDQEKRTSWRFATAHERLPEGLPSWFKEKDADLDGQIAMYEYAKEWTDELAAEFMAMDVNADGVLSPFEANGSVARASSSSSNEAGDKGQSKASSGSVSRAATAGGGPQKTIPKKFMDWAASTIKRYDKNKDGFLSETEMKEMRRPPKNADANRDGRVSAAEYARSVMPKSSD